jgi:hypothetical protein
MSKIIMRDCRARDAQQEKLERAIGYLKERGIWRGCARCNHHYSSGPSVLPRPSHPGQVLQ